MPLPFHKGIITQPPTDPASGPFRSREMRFHIVFIRLARRHVRQIIRTATRYTFDVKHGATVGGNPAGDFQPGGLAFRTCSP